MNSEGKITKLCTVDAYQVVRAAETSDFYNEPIVEIDVDDVIEGDEVYVDLGDFYAGPYRVDFRPSTQTYYIRPEIKNSKYTISGFESDEYIQTIAKIFGVDIKSIKHDVDKIISKANYARRKEESAKVKQDAIGYSDRVNPDYIKAPAAAKCEENLLGLLLMYPEHRKAVFDNGLVDDGDFFTDLNRRIFNYLRDAYFNSDDSHTDIDEVFTPDERGRITRMKVQRLELTDNGSLVLNESIDRLKSSVRKKQNEQNISIENLNKLLEQKRRT